jgi:hypothetical protein
MSLRGGQWRSRQTFHEKVTAMPDVEEQVLKVLVGLLMAMMELPGEGQLKREIEWTQSFECSR